MDIRVSTLRSVLSYSDNIDRDRAAFFAEVEKALGASLQLTALGDYDCDLKLIFIETGGSEGLFLQAFDQLREPYYILTNGANNSLAASLEIMTYLNMKGLKGEVLHGDPAYIAARIASLARINAIRRKLQETRLGIIGEPSDWLIASVPTAEALKEKLGITVVRLPIDDVAKLAKSGEPMDLGISDGVFDALEVTAANAVGTAFDTLVKQHRLDAMTVRCFDLLPLLKTTGCLGLSYLNDHGIPAACEGDVAALVSMLLVKLLTGQTAFQANPSRIDVTKDEMILAHCTIPLSMLEKYRLDTHFESGIGTAIAGDMRRERVTVFRLSANLTDYYVDSGEIIEALHESNLCRTQIRVRMDHSLTPLLTTPCGNHHIVLYGDHRQAITDLMKNL